jgi:hypothetical protein
MTVTKIEVTDLDTQVVTVYDYSKDNWRKAWACMRNGLVIMWAPSQLPPKGGAIRTSGRRWRLV